MRRMGLKERHTDLRLDLYQQNECFSWQTDVIVIVTVCIVVYQNIDEHLDDDLKNNQKLKQMIDILYFELKEV